MCPSSHSKYANSSMVMAPILKMCSFLNMIQESRILVMCKVMYQWQNSLEMINPKIV